MAGLRVIRFGRSPDLAITVENSIVRPTPRRNVLVCTSLWTLAEYGAIFEGRLWTVGLTGVLVRVL